MRIILDDDVAIRLHTQARQRRRSLDVTVNDCMLAAHSLLDAHDRESPYDAPCRVG
jgi:hypothetical protein